MISTAAGTRTESCVCICSKQERSPAHACSRHGPEHLFNFRHGAQPPHSQEHWTGLDCQVTNVLEAGGCKAAQGNAVMMPHAVLNALAEVA